MPKEQEIRASEYDSSKVNLGKHIAIYSAFVHQWLHYEPETIKKVEPIDNEQISVVFQTDKQEIYPKRLVMIYG